MKDNFDDYPLGVVVPAIATAICRAMRILGSCLALLVAIALGVFAWNTLMPSIVGVGRFNQWYQTNLSSRQIYYEENGFVDSEFYASIPMTQQEFNDTIEAIGMQKSSSRSRELANNGPWWFEEPKSTVFILNRTTNQHHRDYIEGHYDPKKSRGYFRYFDT